MRKKKQHYISMPSKLNADINYYACLGEKEFPDKVPYKNKKVVEKKKEVIEEHYEPLVRPKSEYSNHTPYGIADQLHRMEAFS